MMVLPVGPAPTWHSSANRVREMTVVSSRKDFPGTTSVNSIARVPCLVFIVPVVPAANGPLRDIDGTAGFDSCHLETSDQTFQTVCGLATVSTERSLLANPSLRRLPSVARRSWRDSEEGIPRRQQRSR